MLCRRIQEVFLAASDDGNGVSVDVQCRWADEEIPRLSDQRQTERRSSTTADISVCYRLQYESNQEVSVAGRFRSETQKKASYRYKLIVCLV